MMYLSHHSTISILCLFIYKNIQYLKPSRAQDADTQPDIQGPSHRGAGGHPDHNVTRVARSTASILSTPFLWTLDGRWPRAEKR